MVSRWGSAGPVLPYHVFQENTKIVFLVIPFLNGWQLIKKNKKSKQALVKAKLNPCVGSVGLLGTRL
jgi:hypothetical protein